MESENKMAYKPINKLILQMSAPPLISMFLQYSYNLVDSMFVAKINEQALAAVSLSFPITTLMNALSVWIGVGVNVLIAGYLGQNNRKKADSAATLGLLLSVLVGVTVNIAALLVIKPYYAAFTQNSEIYEYGLSYMKVCAYMQIPNMVHIAIQKMLQATGNMIVPMICGIIGGVSNIILDPLFIFGIGPFPELGVAGAGVATIGGQFLSMCVGQIVLFKGKHAVKVRLWGWKFQGRIVRDIYAVGAPAILMQSIASIMQFGMNIILGTLTETAVAVMGVYGRLQSFIFMPVFGLNQGVLPIMGFNYGARNRKRLMETYKKGLMIACIIMAIGLVAFQLFPRELMAVFNSQNSQEMYDIGIPALRYISLCFLPAAFGIMSSSIFQATAHGFLSLWGSLLRQLVGILPLAWILAAVGGVDLVWFSFPLAELIGTVYFAVALKHLYRTEIRRLDILEENAF